MMNHQSRKFWPRNAKEPPLRIRNCDHPGCGGAGDFRAPKSRSALRDYWWFCLDHVRAYNAAWDYFAGMGPDEIEQMVRCDVTWQRPTWPLGAMGAGRGRIDPEKVRDHFGLFEEDAWRPPAEQTPHAGQDEALRVMDLKAPISVDLLKSRYKELCKLHHPDANGGDKAAEERFKKIGQAYKTLMESLSN